MLLVLLLGLPTELAERAHGRETPTYVGQPAVGTPADLRLVDVDEYSGMAKSTSAPVARDCLAINPPHRLLVNELDRRIRLRLCKKYQPGSVPICDPLTCCSMIVCSNRGPLIATSRACWFLLQGFERLGACIARCVSADACDSWSTPSLFPIAVTPTSLVLETFGVSLRGRGSLACSRFSPVPGPWRCRRVEVAKDRVAGRAARRLALAQHARTTGAKLAMAGCVGRVNVTSKASGGGLSRGQSSSMELRRHEPIGDGHDLAAK